MTFLYNAAFLLFGIFYLPVFLIKAGRAENPRQLFSQRLGFFSREWKQQFIGKKIIWIHAVSVGEVLAASQLIPECVRRFSDYHFVLTTVTPTGQKVARTLEGKQVTACYFPFDFTFAVRNFMKALGPECLLLMETELWPNLLVEARRAHVPVFILNGRLSEKSFRRYKRVLPLLKGLFKKLDFVMTQTADDLRRFAALGVPEEKLMALGNMKFDNIPLEDEASASLAQSLKQKWGFHPEDLIWIAGSTHPGEEKILTDVFTDLRQAQPKLKLVIAPRHIERARGLKQWLERLKFQVRLASDAPSAEAFDILLVDCLGVLKNLYAMADVVFVGGTFGKRGGQNPIEPAGFRRAIVHGPHFVNFLSVYNQLDGEGGAINVRDSVQLDFAVRRLLNHPSERVELGNNAFRTVKNLQGATERHLSWLAGFLKTKSQPERIQYVNAV